MSEQDAQRVTVIWEELARRAPLKPGDFSRFAEETMDPEILYEEDPRWPGADSYAGRDEVSATFEGYREIMGGAVVGVEKVADAGDRQVVLVRFEGRSPGSDVPWEHTWAYICQLRDGKLIYLRAYWEPAEALADAGVSSA